MKLNQPNLLRVITLAGILSASPELIAATHTWTGAGGNVWSAAGNWSGGAPTPGEAAPVVLVFPPAGAKGTTNDIANLVVDQIQVSGDNYVIAAAGAGTNVTLRSQVFGQTFFISGSNSVFTNFTFTLATNAAFNGSMNVSSGDRVTFRSRFTGPGGLVKYGDGTVRLQGGAPNTYAGETAVYGGTIELNHSSNAIPGNLLIGNPGFSATGMVSLMFQHQIADNAAVTVFENGVFDPFVYSEVLGSLTLSNVTQVGGTALTPLNGLTTYGQCSLSGTLQLLGAQRTVNVVDGQLTITGFVENNTGTAGLTKTGAGKLQLNQDNGYNGSTLINGGTLVVAHAGALGTSVFQTQVNPGGALEVAAGIGVTTEPLTLYGLGDTATLILHSNSVWNGDISLQSDVRVAVVESNALATLNSTIGGSGGLMKTGVGQLRLAGTLANSFAGGLMVTNGTVQLAKPAGINAFAGPLWIGAPVDAVETVKLVLLANDQIPDGSPVNVEASGLLDLNNFNDAVGDVTLLQGHVATGTGQLNLKGKMSCQSSSGFLFGYGLITGVLGLGGADRDFEAEATLHIDARIRDGGAPAGIRKIGSNAIYLTNPANDYSGMTLISEGYLGLLKGSVPGTTAAGTVVENNAAMAIYGTQVGAESLLLLSTNPNNVITFANTNTWAGPVSLGADSVFNAYYTNDNITFTGPITGGGKFIKTLAGTVILGGAEDNLFTGGLIVERGMVELNKAAGATALSCPVVIGSDTNVPNYAIVRLKASHQIINTAPVTIGRSGLLDLGAFNETIGSLTMAGGSVEGTSGLLTLNGNVLAKASPSISDINCRLSLGGVSRTFETEDYSYLWFAKDIQSGGGNAGWTKTGLGYVYLVAPTTYTGETLITAGGVYLYNDAGLGSTAGATVVQPNAELTLSDVNVSGEALTVSSGTNQFFPSLYAEGYNSASNTWSGPITVLNEVGLGCYPGRTLNLAGPISGPGSLRIDGEGSFYFTGGQANTFAGPTRVVTGDVYFGKTNGVAVPAALEISGAYARGYLLQPEQIADQAAVLLDLGALLDLGGRAETIGSLAGNLSWYGTPSRVNNVTNAFRIGGNNQSTLFEGVISGGGTGTNLVKMGNGELKLSGAHPYTGKTLLQSGSLFLTGSLSNSAVTVLTNATLTGNGIIGMLTSVGGTIAPAGYGPAPQYGRLTSLGSINLGGASKLLVDLGGTNAGVNFDQLEMLSGSLTLPGCSLSVTQNFGGAISNQYPILSVVSGGASMGTFTGLGEGANVISSTGRSFRINYFAGTGNNDVVLTQLDAFNAASFTGMAQLPGGIQLNGLGTPNAPYLVQANTNLATTNWVDLGVINADAGGALQFLDSAAANYPMRFYRFRAQ